MFLGKDDTGNYILDDDEPEPTEAERWWAEKLLRNWREHQRGDLSQPPCPHTDDFCVTELECIDKIVWWARYYYRIEEGFMLRWDRAARVVFCGRCRHQIEIGNPVLLISVDGLRRSLRRCVECAGPAPPDLPEYEPPQRPEFLAPREPGEPEPRREWLPYRED